MEIPAQLLRLGDRSDPGCFFHSFLSFGTDHNDDDDRSGSSTAVPSTCFNRVSPWKARICDAVSTGLSSASVRSLKRAGLSGSWR